MPPTVTSGLPAAPDAAPAVSGAPLPAVSGSPRRSRDKRRGWLRSLRHAVVGALLLVALGAAVLALRPRPVPVDVAQARRGVLVVAIEEPGVTRVKDRYTVSAPVTGHVSRLSLEAGDAVHEGEPLAEIAPALSPLLDERTRAEAEARLGAVLSALGQARSLVTRARVARELADQELSRARSLAATGSLPKQTLEQAEFSARMRAEEETSADFAGKVAAEEVRLARVALGRDGQRSPRDRHLNVLAPVSGRVLRVHQKSAGVVQAGTPIVEIGDPKALDIVVDLLTTDAVHVKPGTAVVVQGWGGDAPLAGKVSRVEPSAFTRPSALGVDEQRVNVVVALTEAPDRWSALGDGYRVEARLVLWRGEDVLRVPQGAVFRYGDGWAVYELRGSTAALTPVRIGHRGDTEVEITSGLSPGASVAVHPGDRVKDGVRVEPR
jgi:HlyD family secretion protein